MKTKTGFKKYVIIITFLLISTAAIAPLTQGITLKNIGKNILSTIEKKTSPKYTTLGFRDFSITIHRIKKDLTPPSFFMVRKMRQRNAFFDYMFFLFL